MATKAKTTKPEGYHAITPHLVVRGATKAIDWYRKVFGAKEVFRMDAPGGTLMHAELQIGDSLLMLADESPTMGARAPGPGDMPVALMLYVDDVDQVFDRAVKEGARAERAVANQFYGDRAGSLVDPFGYRWNVATHIEDMSADEMKQRGRDFMATATEHQA